MKANVVKMSFSKTEIVDILKALYCEKSEIVKVKKLNSAMQQSNDKEYQNNANLRVKFEQVLGNAIMHLFD